MRKFTALLLALAALVAAATHLLTNSISLAQKLPQFAAAASMAAVAFGLEPKVITIESIRLPVNWAHGPPSAIPCAHEPDPDRKIVAADPNITEKVGAVFPPLQIPITPDGVNACGNFVSHDPGGGSNSAAMVSILAYSIRR
jgi:hypothetical protein